MVRAFVYLATILGFASAWQHSRAGCQRGRVVLKAEEKPWVPPTPADWQEDKAALGSTPSWLASAAAPPAEGRHISPRFVAFSDYMSRWHPDHASAATLAATADYAAIAERAGLSPAQLAILWCRTRPFIAAHGSVIIGGTSLEQLKENLDAFALPAEAMTENLAAEIDEVHMRAQNPSNSL